MTGRQNRMIVPGMTLCRTDVADAAVPVLVVVPVHELSGRGANLVEVGKALGGELRPVCGSPEQRPDKGVVITNASPLKNP